MRTRDLLWARRGRGLVPQCADDRRRGAGGLRGGSKALALKDRATRRSVRYRRAAVRYVKDSTPRRCGAGPRVCRGDAQGPGYPDDLEAATLSRTRFSCWPRRGTRDVKEPAVQRLHATLEKILLSTLSPRSVPSLHPRTSRRLCRAGGGVRGVLMKSIPAPATSTTCRPTLERVGRWADSVRANIEGVAFGPEGGDRRRLRYLPEHKLHMSLYAASMDGQGAIAIQRGVIMRS